MNRGRLRDVCMIALMLGAFAFVQLNPIEKVAPSEKIQLSQLIPKELPPELPRWKSISYDMSNYQDQWQSINELLVRKYYQRNQDNVDFILEYSSDMRKNFSFHFPESCHRSGGNEVDFLEPLSIPLDGGRTLMAKLIFIRGVRGSVEPHDKLVAYWLVIDQKHYHKTFWVKVDQMVAGLLKQSKTGMLIRLDVKDGIEYSDAGISKGRELMRRFVQDLYGSTHSDARAMLFGQ